MNALQSLRIGLTALVISFLSGCLPIPVLPFGDTKRSRQNITDTVPDFIAVGRTTRGEVLLMLGDPDQKRFNDEQFLYFRETEEGGIAFVVGGGGRGGVIGTPVTFRVLTIVFDRAGVVANVNARKFTKRDFFGELEGDDFLW